MAQLFCTVLVCGLPAADVLATTTIVHAHHVQRHSTPLCSSTAFSQQTARPAIQQGYPSILTLRPRPWIAQRSPLLAAPAALNSPINQSCPVCQHRPLPRNSPIPPLPLVNRGICYPLSTALHHRTHPTENTGRASPHCPRTSLHRHRNAPRPRRLARGALRPGFQGIVGPPGSGCRGKGVLAAIQHRGFPGDHSAQY